VRSLEPRIRRAAAGDVDALARIWDAGWRDAHLGRVPVALLSYRTADSYSDRIRDRLPNTWTGLHEGRVAGFVVVIDDEIEQLYVDGRARGTGLGVSLLREGERRIGAAGHDRAWLAVAVGNVEARAFYERVGWSDAGQTDYEAEAGDSVVLVPCRRYEKAILLSN
jgi:ribosomal protein S18 acetylase RimI-like enzyme